MIPQRAMQYFCRIYFRYIIDIPESKAFRNVVTAHDPKVSCQIPSKTFHIDSCQQSRII